MNISQVEKRSGLTREQFAKEYLIPQKPVVFKDLISDWPAKEKWTFEYLQNKFGDIEVPLYDKSYSEPGAGYMQSCCTMKLRDYLELIRTEPTDLRMFLFNIFKEVPELVADVRMPDIMDGFMNEFPFMFFGGQGSAVKMHYDIDCSHVFLTQFQTKKRVTLFSPDQSKYLYHMPFTVASLVDFKNPDASKYPALNKVHGWQTVLEHGETLFIPSMYWHYIEYVEGGYSLALRASDRITNRLRGAFNIARHYVVDKGLNLLMGDKWHEIKEDIAFRRARA